MTDLPMPRTITEADAMLADARMVLDVQRSNRGSIVGLARIRNTIDRLLDARLRLSGPPVCMSVDAATGKPCGRVKDRYGTEVWLCSECDFRRCANPEQGAGCGKAVRRIIALGRGPLTQFGVCPNCGRTI